MSKKVRVIISFVMLAVVLFTALPKVYLHKLMGHTHVIEQNLTGEDNFASDNNTQNCGLEKFETPVYFTIFKFILNCSPFRRTGETVSDNYQERFPDRKNADTITLRGPPAV
ncbi:MAG: hypothetical protein Q8M29_07085 [Bacteroidota bacterium]|nr:hypothetical protein [Bacteroidota bacterium]